MPTAFFFGTNEKMAKSDDDVERKGFFATVNAIWLAEYMQPKCSVYKWGMRKKCFSLLGRTSFQHRSI